MIASLADLSRALDEAAQPGEPAANPVAAFEQWGASREAPRPLRRRNLVDYWPMGFAVAASSWMLFVGALLFAGGSRQPAYAEVLHPVPDTSLIEPLDDPVQTGRGGRMPTVVPADTALQPDCLGTRVAFVDTLPEAIRQAKQQNKLLMVLNVSGDFEESRFT
jgi:hypothetical protein